MSKRILVVDESAMMRDTLMHFLQTSDYLVAVASSQDQALDIMKTEHYDIIIIDINMPDMRGFDLIRSVSELDGDPGLVIVSHEDARALHSARELAMAYSVNLLGTLIKPIDEKQLLAILDDVVGVRDPGSKGSEAVLSEAEFMRGLVTDGLVPVFQPRIDMTSGAIAGAEVFARWRASGGGLLGAGAVVRLARDQGHMDILTYRMLELALEQQGSWKQQGHLVKLSVNVSSDNLRKRDFANVVSGLAEQFDIDPAMLVLELSETDFQISDRVPLDILAQLHERGFGLALDDFGAGFGLLMRFKHTSFTEMIIDREFVGRAVEDSKAKLILETAIGLAHKLDMTCCCEGVESEKDMTLVKELGADTAQGYLLGKPMSHEEFLIWMEDYRDGLVDFIGSK